MIIGDTFSQEYDIDTHFIHTGLSKSEDLLPRTQDVQNTLFS